jgi:hypothetical protein
MPRLASLRRLRTQRPELGQIAPFGIRVHVSECRACLLVLLLSQVSDAQQDTRAARILDLALAQPAPQSHDGAILVLLSQISAT